MRFNTRDDARERDNQDAFGRVRISGSHMLMSSQLTFDKRPLDWLEQLTTGGTATHLPNESSVSMAVTSTSGSKVLRQTRRYFLYRAGHSLLPIYTMSDMSPTASTEKRVGYFDDNNGVFLQSDDTNMALGVRSYTTGSAVDTLITQTNWNRDKLDGTGLSGVNMDFTKTCIFFVDVQWLGVGTVRCGFDFDSERIVCHEFRHGNAFDKVYMTTALLPCRYEIETMDGDGAGASMKQICTSVAREGGLPEPPVPSACATGWAGTATEDTPRSLLSVRLKSGYNRAYALPTDWDIFNDGNQPVEFRLIFNPTLGGALSSWTSAGPTSALEYSLTQQEYTAGTGHTMGVKYIDSTGGAKANARQQIDSSVGLAADIGGTADIISIVADSDSGTQNVRAAMGFNELY